MLRDVGDIPITHADEMNIPVVCFLNEPDRENGMWSWTARNFMPRRECCIGGYQLEADTKEEIIEAINKHVVPLYVAATNNLKEKGNNYLWECTTIVKVTACGVKS